MRLEKKILPCAAILQGEYGISGPPGVISRAFSVLEMRPSTDEVRESQRLLIFPLFPLEVIVIRHNARDHGAPNFFETVAGEDQNLGRVQVSP